MSKIISEEILEKIRSAKSAKELVDIADKVGVKLSMEDATRYFEQLSQQDGMLSDDELDKVTGGILKIIEKSF